MDKIYSIYQGRPARLSGIDTSVPAIFHDDYEELEPFSAVTFTDVPCRPTPPRHSVSTLAELCKLSRIMDKILRELYSENSRDRDVSDLFNVSMILHHELKCWRSEMPPHLNVRLRGPSTAVILPHTLALV